MRVSRQAWRLLNIVASNPDWLIFLFAFLVIGLIYDCHKKLSINKEPTTNLTNVRFLFFV